MSKKTPFYDKHVALGGHLVDFAGFIMPTQYKGIIEEVKRVRTTVGVFDVSHMGEIEIKGPDALKFISKITVNDPSALSLNQVQYSAMCYNDGGIVDDLLVYRLKKRYLLVVNASNIDKDFKWIKYNVNENVTVKNISDDIAQLAIQGPDAEKVMQKLTDIDLSKIDFYWAIEGKIADIETVLSRTGYTGEDGFEVYFDKKYADKMWDTIFNAGEEFNIEVCGLGARDILRLEMYYRLYGNDIDSATTPIEGDLSWITRLNKTSFNGREVLLKQKVEGLTKKLVPFEMIDKGIPRHGYEIKDKDRNIIGYVTSGNLSPMLQKYIGCGYVKLEYSSIDSEFTIDIRGRLLKAKVVKTPFYKDGTHK